MSSLSSVMITDPYDVLKKAHISILRHRETYLYSGVLMLGDNIVSDEVPTAVTNGRDKIYGRAFLMSLTPQEVVALVLHEGLHIFLKHLSRHKDLMEEDARLANAAMDYVVNSIIVNLRDKSLAKLPKGGLYDPKFDDWSVRQIYDFLKTGKNPQGDKEGEPQPVNGGDGDAIGVKVGDKTYLTNGQDEHESGGNGDDEDGPLKPLSADEEAELNKQIDDAIQQSALLAGMAGGDVPRAVRELLQPEVNWVEVLNEWITSRIRGSDEFTYAKFNRKRLASGLYRPSTYSERVGRIIVAFDTSGSISDAQINKFITELVAICDVAIPDEVMVLWWDTHVAGVQSFIEPYGNMVDALKPAGYGGTRVSCVSEYIVNNNIEADGLIVFTDGHVEGNINWATTLDTLWVITDNDSFTPPSGVKIKFK